MRLQIDKVKHYIAITIIVLVVLVSSHLWYPMQYNWDLGLACVVGILFAAGKEIVIDKWFGWGQPELMDFFWGFAAAVITPALWLVGEMMLGVAQPLPNF